MKADESHVEVDKLHAANKEKVTFSLLEACNLSTSTCDSSAVILVSVYVFIFLSMSLSS